VSPSSAASVVAQSLWTADKSKFGSGGWPRRRGPRARDEERRESVDADERC
jgi:hypothetical protein